MCIGCQFPSASVIHVCWWSVLLTFVCLQKPAFWKWFHSVQTFAWQLFFSLPCLEDTARAVCHPSHCISSATVCGSSLGCCVRWCVFPGLREAEHCAWLPFLLLPPGAFPQEVELEQWQGKHCWCLFSSAGHSWAHCCLRYGRHCFIFSVCFVLTRNESPAKKLNTIQWLLFEVYYVCDKLSFVDAHNLRVYV